MTESLSAPLDDFKERELEILNLMAEGLSNREIADKLFITKETVRWYNKQIYSKLGTSRRTEAIALARNLGLIGEDYVASDDTPQHKLPITNGPFIGRDEELAELSALLSKTDVRLVSIIAAGGMGKSRLSLELAHVIQSNYELGAVFIDLTPVRNPDDIAKAALDMLNIPVGGKQEPKEALLNYCREKNLLLIFDNMEHVLSGASLLADILATAPGVKLIATSRERLNLRVETTFYLQPVTDNAASLFIELAETMRPGIVTYEEKDTDDVNHIVELVGGMPLALVLAATWVDMLSLQEIAQEIQNSLDFLSAELADMPDRQRSIRAVIEPSWKRLSEAEQKAFMWASVFRGGFTREMFQQVTGASIRVLQTLLTRSLIMHSYERRYDMHPLIRQFAREKLETHGEFTDAKQAHLNACLTYVQGQNDVMFNGYYMESLKNIDTEQDNYRTALDWSLNGNAVAGGTQLALAICKFWDIRSQAYEAEHYLSLALIHDLQDAFKAQVLCWRSRFKYRLGMLDDAQKNAGLAVSLVDAQQDKETLARSLIYLSYLLPVQEEYEMAKRALAISEEIEHQQLIAMSLNAIGISHYKQQESQKALKYFQRSQGIFESLGDLRGVSMVVYNIGLHYEKLGKTALVRQHYEHSLELKRQIGDRAGMARRLSVLAYNDLLDEELERSAERLQESRLICEEIGDRQRWTYNVMIEACVQFAMTNFSQSQQTLEEGLTVVTDMDDNIRLSEYYNLLGMIHLSQNHIDQAKNYFVRCLEIANKLQLPYHYWLSLMGYAQFLWITEQSVASVRITAVVYRFRSLGTAFDLRYLFDPYVYRLEKHIGLAAWDEIQRKTKGLTLEQVFRDALETLEL